MKNCTGSIFPVEFIWMGESHIWTPELCQSGHELSREWPYCIFLWANQSVLGESEGRRHISQPFVFRYPGILSQSLVSDVGELVYSKERLSGKSWKISFTRDLIWVLSAEWVSASPWPDRTQGACFPPQGSWPELKPPPKSEWNF